MKVLAFNTGSLSLLCCLLLLRSIMSRRFKRHGDQQSDTKSSSLCMQTLDLLELGALSVHSSVVVHVIIVSGLNPGVIS